MSRLTVHYPTESGQSRKLSGDALRLHGDFFYLLDGEKMTPLGNFNGAMFKADPVLRSFGAEDWMETLVLGCSDGLAFLRTDESGERSGEMVNAEAHVLTLAPYNGGFDIRKGGQPLAHWTDGRQGYYSSAGGDLGKWLAIVPATSDDVATPVSRAPRARPSALAERQG